MSDRTRARSYLASCLARDPAAQPGSILELRRRRRGKGEPVKASGPAREDVSAALARVRSEFYELEDDELARALETISTDGYPDLARHLRRLEEVAPLRGELRAAAADAQLDKSFVGLFQECAVARRRDAVRLQEECLERMKVAAWHKSARDSARRLQKKYPRLAALMPGWLEQIERKPRPSLGGRRNYSKAYGCLGIYFLVRIVVYVVKHVLGVEGGVD